jgi:hypothetical protein
VTPPQRSPLVTITGMHVDLALEQLEIVAVQLDESAALINKIRFGAADWSKVNWPWPIGATQTQADDIQPPGITLCFGSHFSEDDLKGTYVRLQP